MTLMRDHHKVVQRLLVISPVSDTHSSVHGEQKRSDVAPKGIIAVVSLLMFAGLAYLVSPLLGTVIIASTLSLVLGIRHTRCRRRSEALERDLPALITSLASSVRAGVDPIFALADARRYFTATSPWSEELESFRATLSQGVDEAEAIDKLCSEYNHPDVQLLKRCLLLSRRHGSSLAEPLHRIARVVRQRQSFRRKTRAALAMHRLSACGIGVCAVLIGAMQAIVNRAGLQVVSESSTGIAVLSSGALCVVAGLSWMFRMGREEMK